MDATMTTILAVVAVYFALSLGLGFWVARGERNVADDYFLAGRKLPWYAVSMSMTGSNIGTEHFMGMVGTAYVFGLAPATFEWGNFIPYSILIWIFLPFFFRKKLYTIPEFLERRYNRSTRTAFACLTLFHMVIGVLVPALYAGGRILYEMPLDATLEGFNWPFMGCVLIIAGVTAAYCIYGGLLSVVWTDVLQVAILVIGGVLLVWIGAQDVGGMTAVVETNRQADASRMSLILPADHAVSPWTGVATFWLTLSLWYVGTNQFYIQRCLGAKSEWDAKMGVIGCGFLKVFLPLIIVIPGLIAFAKFGSREVTGLADDRVYVAMIKTFLSPEGLLGTLGPLAQGLLLAALIAAIMSSVSSVLNSASTIWSIDIHQRLIDSSSSEAELVGIGRWATLITIVIGAALAPMLLYWKAGIFIFIQNVAALLAPPIAVIFLAAFLWRRAHGRAATFTLWFGMIAGAVLWLGTSLLWIGQTVDLEDPAVQGRLAAVLNELPEEALLRKYLDEDPLVRRRLAEVQDRLAKDPPRQVPIAHQLGLYARLIEDAAVRERLAEDEVFLQRREVVLRQSVEDPTVKAHVIGILQQLTQDAVIRQQIATDRGFREQLLADPHLQRRLAEDAVIQRRLAADSVIQQRISADPVLREQIANDEGFRKQLGEEPAVLEHLVEDPAFREHVAEDEAITGRLAGDPAVTDHLARQRLAAWVPLLGEDALRQTVTVIDCIRPLLNRAAVSWGLCLIVMIVTTITVRQDPRERYDPDTIWNLRWARLPASERQLNAGGRNLMFWWLLMVAASASLFAIFR